MSIERVLRFLLAVMALTLVLAPTAWSQYHEDTRHGFKFKPPSEYSALPVTPNDRFVIAKFIAEQMEYGGEQGFTSLQKSFNVFFFEAPKQAPPKPVKEVEDGPKDEFDEFEEDLAKEVVETISPTEKAWEWATKRLGDCEVVKTKLLKVGRARGEERHFLIHNKDKVMRWVGVLEQEDGVFVFVGSAFEKNFKKRASAYTKATKSFKRIEKDGTLNEGKNGDTQLSKQEQFLKTQIDRLPAGWASMRTERYLFLYSADKGFVKELANRIEAMRDVYKEMWPPDKPIEAISIVRVCGSRQEYMGYGGSAGSGGYWNSGEKELVFFDSPPRTETLAVLNHEAFHQYIFYACGELAPHSWYNEGTGDYFAGAKMTRTHRIKAFGDSPGGFARLQTAKQACRLRSEGRPLADGVAVPLKDLLRYTQQEYYKDGLTHYAQGWAVVHMLREGKGLTKDWKGILDRYFEALLTSRHEVAVEAMQEAVDLAKKRGDSEEAIDGISKDPKDFYSRVNRDRTATEEIRTRAYNVTFGGWSDHDWEDFDNFYLKYVEKL